VPTPTFLQLELHVWNVTIVCCHCSIFNYHWHVLRLITVDSRPVRAGLEVDTEMAETRKITGPGTRARADDRGRIQKPRAATKKTAKDVQQRANEVLEESIQATTTTSASTRTTMRAAASNPAKRNGPQTSKRKTAMALSHNEETPVKQKKGKQKPEPAEKRQRKYRSNPPLSFLQKLERARTQRMIVLSRNRITAFSEEIAIVGSTGNIYTVTISHLPSCTCPDHANGNQCKHVVYALHTVLRAPSQLEYQLAFLTAELEEIFSKAPPIPTETVSEDNESTNGKRKPIEEGSECPICYMDLLPDSEELVWCKAACGNNMHKTCFEQWAASQRGQVVKCVYCRTPWETNSADLATLQRQGTVNDEGYVNVAGQFGMSGQRDYSSYHPFWVRRTLGTGY
jgi:hypothetical protein